MSEKPIIFSTPMVRAILDGRKTQTRRVIKPQPHQSSTWKNPYGRCGDRLWVRETWWKVPEPALKQLRDGADTWPRPIGSQEQRIAYAADEPSAIYEEYRQWGWELRPAIFMPRWASRITLEITEVRVQRLQEITEEDAKSEGVDSWTVQEQKAKIKFESLWNSINAERGFGWNVNPWVWAISFKRVIA